MRGTIAAIPILCAALGCGYQSPSVSEYLSHIDSIRVQVVNQTSSFDLGDELQNELSERFDVKWDVGAGDDSLLLVTAYDYEIEPRRYNINGQVEQWRMSLLINYTFEDNVNRELIAKEDGFARHRDFFTVAGQAEPPEDEATARLRLLEELTDTLYGQVAEQW